jgi:hypothetical protein
MWVVPARTRVARGTSEDQSNLNFVPCASDEARKRYPQLNHDLTKKDLTVVDDDGGVYFGPKAWLMVLWALVDIASGPIDSQHRNCCPLQSELFR